MRRTRERARIAARLARYERKRRKLEGRDRRIPVYEMLETLAFRNLQTANELRCTGRMDEGHFS